MYRKIHPRFWIDGEIKRDAVSVTREHGYCLSLTRGDSLSGAEATKMHRDLDLRTVGCIELPYDELSALLKADQRWPGAIVSLIDDGSCEDVPAEHCYLDLGNNSKGVRKVLVQQLHEIVMRCSWAHGPDEHLAVAA